MTIIMEKEQQLHNPSDIERALARFAEAAVSSPTNPPGIPSELDFVLREIATVGVPYYGWGGLKELFAARMVEAVGALEKESGFVRTAGGKDYPQRRDELVASLRSFDAAPFTLQRLAEVLQDPRRQYTTTHKLINGLERLLSVSSTLSTKRRQSGAAPPPPPPPAAAKTSTPAVTSAAEATAIALQQHDSARNGSAQPSPSSVVAVKVEEGPGSGVGTGAEGGDGSKSNGSVDATVVPVDEPAAREGVDGWNADSHGKRGPGRKRLKVDVKPEAPAMSE